MFRYNTHYIERDFANEGLSSKDLLSKVINELPMRGFIDQEGITQQLARLAVKYGKVDALKLIMKEKIALERWDILLDVIRTQNVLNPEVSQFIFDDFMDFARGDEERCNIAVGMIRRGRYHPNVASLVFRHLVTSDGMPDYEAHRAIACRILDADSISHIPLRTLENLFDKIRFPDGTIDYNRRSYYAATALEKYEFRLMRGEDSFGFRYGDEGGKKIIDGKDDYLEFLLGNICRDGAPDYARRKELVYGGGYKIIKDTVSYCPRGQEELGKHRVRMLFDNLDFASRAEAACMMMPALNPTDPFFDIILDNILSTDGNKDYELCTALLTKNILSFAHRDIKGFLYHNHILSKLISSDGSYNIEAIGRVLNESGILGLIHTRSDALEVMMKYQIFPDGSPNQEARNQIIHRLLEGGMIVPSAQYCEILLQYSTNDEDRGLIESIFSEELSKREREESEVVGLVVDERRVAVDARHLPPAVDYVIAPEGLFPYPEAIGRIPEPEAGYGVADEILSVQHSDHEAENFDDDWFSEGLESGESSESSESSPVSDAELESLDSINSIEVYPGGTRHISEVGDDRSDETYSDDNDRLSLTSFHEAENFDDDWFSEGLESGESSPVSDAELESLYSINSIEVYPGGTRHISEVGDDRSDETYSDDNDRLSLTSFSAGSNDLYESDIVTDSESNSGVRRGGRSMIYSNNSAPPILDVASLPASFSISKGRLSDFVQRPKIR